MSLSPDDETASECVEPARHAAKVTSEPSDEVTYRAHIIETGIHCYRLAHTRKAGTIQ